MHGRLLRAAQGLKGADDQIFPRLREHLNGDVIRDAVLFNQLANEVEVGLRGGWESHLNFFESAAQQQVPELQLAGAVHRLGKGLVAVAQIG